jgi:hypothetical protein
MPVFPHSSGKRVIWTPQLSYSFLRMYIRLAANEEEVYDTAPVTFHSFSKLVHVE